MREKILSRERECFELLSSIPPRRKAILIGGYAASSFLFPRLSVDLDIVIPKQEVKFFREWVKKHGFVLSKKKSDFDLTYGGQYEKYVRAGELPISVDLLINSVTARQTNYSYSFDYLLKNSELREIRGWHPASRVKLRVADKEILIALKINSMRAADKRDIIMLCYELPKIDKIIKHLKNCPKAGISKNINDLFEVLSVPKLKDSMKGVFVISDDVLGVAIENCKKLINELKVSLSV